MFYLCIVKMGFIFAPAFQALFLSSEPCFMSSCKWNPPQDKDRIEALPCLMETCTASPPTINLFCYIYIPCGWKYPWKYIVFPSFGSPLCVLVRVSCFEPLWTAPSALGLQSFLFHNLCRLCFWDSLPLPFDGLVLVLSFNIRAWYT